MIYLVEDDDSIRELVLYTLHTTGFEAEGFQNAADFWQALEKELPQLVLLDIMLPDEDGLHILKRLRAGAETADLPVMMLTAKSSEYDRVVGLDSGADDYLVKPFEMEELEARIRTVTRRGHAEAAADRLSFADMSYEPETLRLTGPAGEAVLSRRDGQVLETLLRSAQNALPRETVIRRVWGVDSDVETTNLDNYIHFLRRRLKSLNSRARITNVWGVGFLREDSHA